MSVDEILQVVRKALYDRCESTDLCEQDKARTAIQGLWLIETDLKDIQEHHDREELPF
jgi:hypothetical protein